MENQVCLKSKNRCQWLHGINGSEICDCHDCHKKCYYLANIQNSALCESSLVEQGKVI